MTSLTKKTVPKKTSLPILLTPGPVPIPDSVLQALALPMEHHRTPEFIALWNRVLANLKKVFRTAEPVFVHTSTGSGAMESALVNILSPGDEVIVIVSGKFGERWAEIAEIYGAKVHRLVVPWGKAVEPAQVAEALKNHPRAVAVFTQACETSTGVLHPIRELAKVVAPSPALLAVDGITALGAVEMPMDDWGIDVLIAGSQKAFMLPTGISFISLSQKAWRKAEAATCPRFYFDLRRERTANQNGESYFSSAVTHIRALDLVLEIFLQQGLERVHARINALSRATIEAAAAMGLEVFTESPSPSLTALKVPAGIDGQKLRGDLESAEAVIVMGGQDQLKGKVVRIGHMGAISDVDQIRTLEALANSINRLRPGTISDSARDKALARASEILAASPAVVMQV